LGIVYRLQGPNVEERLPVEPQRDLTSLGAFPCTHNNVRTHVGQHDVVKVKVGDPTDAKSCTSCQSEDHEVLRERCILGVLGRVVA
jgi:hypothetical protein